jgi:hypothetical protein
LEPFEKPKIIVGLDGVVGNDAGKTGPPESNLFENGLAGEKENWQPY